MPIGNCEVLFAAVYKFPGHAWNDAENIELLCFRRKLILRGDLNAKRLVWNSTYSNTWREFLRFI